MWWAKCTRITGCGHTRFTDGYGKEDVQVSQPNALANGQTAVVPNSNVGVSQEKSPMFKFSPGPTIEDIVKAVNQVGAAPGDLMAILEALKQKWRLKSRIGSDLNGRAEFACSRNLRWDIYTDVNSLAETKNVKDPKAALSKVVMQFESMFIGMMLKSMQANAAFEEDGLFESKDSLFYRDMYDQQLSIEMAKRARHWYS